jgi:hypothetical protein
MFDATDIRLGPTCYGISIEQDIRFAAVGASPTVLYLPGCIGWHPAAIDGSSLALASAGMAQHGKD